MAAAKVRKTLGDVALVLLGSLWLLWAYAFLGEALYQTLLMLIGGLGNVAFALVRSRVRSGKAMRWALLMGVCLLNAFCMLVAAFYTLAFLVILSAGK